MNPWTVIGWIILTGLAVIPLLAVATLLGNAISHGYSQVIAHRAYIKTRTIRPAKGQVWVTPEGLCYLISTVTSEGVYLSKGKRLIGDQCPWIVEDWQAYVDRRKLYLHPDYRKVGP